MPKRRNGELTEKERRFCDEYLTDFNASRSARAAGYPKKSAGAIGNENLQKPEIQEYLASRKAKVAEKLGFKAEDTIRGLINIAQFDIRNALEFGEEEVEIPAPVKDGKPVGKARRERRNFVRLKDSKTLDPATAYAITGVTLKKDGSLSLRVADKKGALDTLARHQDLVKEAINVTADATLIESMNERDAARRIALLLARGMARA